MGIRAIIAAAAVAVGIGQAASAATVVDYDIDLKYMGTNFLDGHVSLDGWIPEAFEFDKMPVEGNPFGLVSRYSHLAVGEIVKFVAHVIYPDDPDKWIGSFDNGGRAPSCSLAGISCGAINQAYPGNNFQLFDWDESEYYGSLTIGDVFKHQLWGPAVTPQPTAEVFFFTWFETAEFEVVAVHQPVPAPVPLPATAALLPLGIGALALMRRRRRQVS